MPHLKIQSLQVRIGRQRILHGVDLEVPADSVTMLFGANGAGKTTLFNAISGLIPWTGKIIYDGQEFSPRMTPHKIFKQGIVHVPEGRGVFPQLTVEEHLLIGARARGLSRTRFMDERERVYELLPLLKNKGGQRGATLSGGEQQLLALGKALISRPKLLLVDEPCMGLSPIATQEVFSVFQRIRSEWRLPILINEQQNIGLAVELSHTVYLLEAGRIIGSGPAGEILNEESMRQFYLTG